MPASHTKVWIRRAVGPRLYGYLQFRHWRRRVAAGTYDAAEMAVVRRLVCPGAHVLDVGAHVGLYTVPLSRLVGPRGRVYGVEPNGRAFSILERIVRSFRLDNVQTIRAALGRGGGAASAELAVPLDAHGNETLSRSYLGPATGPSGSGSENRERSRTETVALTSLVELVDAGDIPRVDFVKCDVEGAELPFLQGGARTLERFAPAILCEIEARHASRFGHRPQQVVDFLDRLGYALWALRGDALVPATRVRPGTINYFALPRGQAP